MLRVDFSNLVKAVSLRNQTLQEVAIGDSYLPKKIVLKIKEVRIKLTIN